MPHCANPSTGTALINSNDVALKNLTLFSPSTPMIIVPFSADTAMP